MNSHLGPGEDVQKTLDLLNRARDGDREAWDLLYVRYRDELFQRVRARLGSELRSVEGTMDVFQSVWGEAIGSLRHFEYQGEGSFLAWLATLLRNKLATRVERLRAVKRGGSPPAQLGTELSEAAFAPGVAKPGPGTRAEDDEERELLLQAVERLPAEQQALVRGVLFDGRTNQEIGDQLGISADAARMRIARAMARLTSEFHRMRE